MDTTMLDVRAAATRQHDCAPRRYRDRRAPPRWRPGGTFLPIVLAAGLALAIVVVAEQVEQSVTDTDAAASLSTASNDLALEFDNGSATINAPARDISVALTTTRIGDRALGAGEIGQGTDEVTQRWAGITEWYRTSGDGFEHGYTIDAPVAAGRVWDVTVDVADGVPELFDTDTVQITRSDGSTLWYRELHAYDDTGRELPAAMNVVDGDISLTIDTTDAQYPVTIDPIITERISSATGSAGDMLGFAVDVDGNRMVVSSPGADVGASAAGIVEVYQRADISAPWVLDATISSPTPEIDGGFGDSLALRGDLLAIGESDAYGDRAEPGKVWVFEKVGAAWVSQGAYTAPIGIGEGGIGDRFGFDFAWIDGTRLLVGAPGTSDGGDVYRIDLGLGTTVNLNAGFTVEVTDELGFAVDVTPQPAGTGYFAAVGMPGRTSTPAGGSGATGGGGQYLITLDATGNPVTWRGGYGFAQGTRAGTSVSIDGTRAVIGQFGTGSMSFELYEYRNYGSGPEWRGDVIRSAGSSTTFETGTLANDYLEIDGDTIAVADPGGGGGAVVFRIADGVLSAGPVDYFSPPERESGDRVGRAMALDGPTLIAGAPGDDGNTNTAADAGAVYSARVQATMTFINTAGTPQPWDVAANWDLGIVPGGLDTAIVPTGTFAAVNAPTSVARLSVAGQLDVGAAFAVTERIVVAGVLDTKPGGTLSLAPAVVLDGQINSDGTILATGPSSISGSGTLVLDDTLRKQGPGILDIGDEIRWRSEYTSTVDIRNGEVVIAGPITEASGSFRIEPGAYLRFPGQDFAPGRGSRLSTRIIGPSTDPANFGHIDVGNRLAYEPAQGSGAALAVSVTVDGGYVVQLDDVYDFVTCIDTCVGDRPDINGLDFDALDLEDDLQVVQTWHSLDLRLLPNKITSAGSTGFGTDIDVDGDWAVVGAAGGDGTAVLRRVGGVWTLHQSLTGTSESNVAIEGNVIVAGGIVFRRGTSSDPFASTTVFGGSTFDIDGDLFVVGDPGTASVWDPTDLVSSTTLAPVGAPASYGADVAVVDLGAGDGVAAISAPADGRVYLFERNAGVWTTTPIAILTSPDGTPLEQFGNSLALSADRLVIGERLNNADTGAAWVYDRTGPGATFGPPTKITGSKTAFGDVFGSSVAIDGDTIVVGAGAHQKYNFPLRDGEAYVFQSDGSAWVETDILQAADGFDGERFGDAVAVSGAGVLVGARQDVNAGGAGAGAVYTFDATPLTPSEFDPVVDIDGDRALVSVPGQDIVYLMRNVGGVWEDEDAISSNGAFSDFGADVAIDWPYIAISAPESDRVLTYEYVAGFQSLSDLGGGSGSGFGTSIDAANGQLAIGAPSDDGNGAESGLVTVFDLATGTENFALSDGQSGDRFGAALSLTGADLWVGAPGDDGVADTISDSGAVYRYDDGGNTAGVIRSVSTANARFGSTVDSTAKPDPGGFSRAVFGAAGALDVVTFDTGAGYRVIADGSQGFGNAVAITENYVHVYDEGYPQTYTYLRDAATGGYSRLKSFSPDVNRSIAAEGDVLIRSKTVTGPTTSGLDAARFDIVSVTGLTFDLGLAAGSPASVSVRPDGISVNQLDRTAVASRGGAANNVAASSISTIGPKDTALASIKLGATPLSSIVLGSVPLSSIPLVKIDIDGGWTKIIEGSTLDREPLSSLTFGQVLAEGKPADPATAPASNTPAGRLADAPLSSIDVDGTPLSSIPLSSIALGSTPLSSIPLSSIGLDWCDIVSDLVPGCVDDTDPRLDDLTVMEITLRGVPLSSIPLSSIPLSSIPLSSIPLSSILLSSIDLSASPLSSIPLSSIPLSSIPLSSTDPASSPLSSIPLSSIGPTGAPLSSIPLSSIPLSSIPLSSISTEQLLSLPTSVPLSSIPLSSIGPNGTPLSSIQLQGAPLSSIPLSSIVLADVPLSSIPLSSIPLSSIQVGAAWCDVLETSGARFNCETGADPATTTLRQLSINGVPLSSIPLSSIPLSSIPLSSIPLSSIPLSSIPLSSIPLSSIPLSSIPLSSIDIAGSPLSSIPLSSIDVVGSPLSSIPLSSIPLSSIPLSSIPLSSIPLSSIPLSSIPLSSIDVDPSSLSTVPLSSIKLSAIDVFGSPLSSIPLSSIPLSSIGVSCARVDCIRGTLGDAYAVGAIPGATTLSQIQIGTSGIRLGELAPFFNTFGSAELAAGLGSLTLDSLNGHFDDVTLGDLGDALQQLNNVTLGQLHAALGGVTFDDLVGAIIDPISREPLPGLDQTLRTEVNQEGMLIDLDTLGDVTLGDLLSEGYQITVDELQPLLGFITVDTFQKAFGLTLTIPPGLSLQDLSAQQLGQLTLADLLAQAGATNLGDLLTEIDADILAGFTFGDLLLALLDPASLAFGGVEFAQVDVGALPPGTVPPATFTSQFELAGEVARTVELEVVMPTAASFVPGSGTLDAVAAGGGTTAVRVDPAVVGKTLRWSTLATPGTTYTYSFDVLPSLKLGPTTLNGTARVAGTDITIPASASITVAEGSEPNDFDPPAFETTPAREDVVYLTYIASPTDNDVYQIDVAEDDKLVIELSNLDADLDLALWGRPDEPSGTAALGQTSDQTALFALTDPDADGADAEPLHDFKRLDAVDPSLDLVQVTNQNGTKSEVLSTGRLDAGTYFIQVYGSNGATNVRPAALQVKVLEADAAPVCQARPPLPVASPGNAPSPAALAGANTLILVNEQRIEQLYDATGRAQVMTAANNLVDFLGNNPALGIDPVIVPVDSYPKIGDAFAAWDTTPCDPDAANAIVGAINSEIIDPIRGQLENVVFLGGDDLIPMARLDDSTLVANEYDFRHEFDGDLTGADANGRNALTSTFWASKILSDDPYGDTAARSLGNRYLYVPDLALGRLVETPMEIADALTTFVDFDGTLDIETATVLGYDFLSDGSAQVADELESAGIGVDDEYADGFRADGGKWNKADATAKLVEAGTNALISLNAHFDHYRALPSIGDQVTNFNDNLIAEQVAATLGPDALRQSLVFSMGCHSGLSVSDIAIGTTNIDWAQTLSAQGSLFVGNTGFGYGDTATVAYTEHLMALFADHMASPIDLDPSAGAAPSTVGQALAWAKNEYVAGLQSFSVYDEKALMESTFYGLPFYRVGRPTSALPPAPINQAVADSTGTPALQVSIVATNTPTSDPSLGTYYSNTDGAGTEQVIVSPGRPIQPKAIRDVSVVDPELPRKLALTAMGAIVLDMNSTYVALANPVIATPIFDETRKQPEPDVGNGAFPTRQLQVTTSTGPSGERQQLVVATGQYRADTRVQRLDNDMAVAVYYAAPGAADHAAPTIGAVRTSVTDGVLSVSVDATDAGQIDRVYVLIGANPGVPGTAVGWTGIDLTRSGTTDRWTGSWVLSTGTTDVELIVQAKDTSGNVGYATNKASNFSTSATPPSPTPTPPPTTLSVIPSNTNLDPISGWYTGDATIKVVATSTAATYFIDGQAKGPIAAGDEFQITGNGPHTWKVVNSGGLPVTGSVRIDADGPPRITVGSPTSGAIYPTGSTNTIDRKCEDTSLASCTTTINGAPVANGARLPATPGNYTLVVIATDRLANSSTTSVPFTIAATSAPPILSPMTGPTIPQNRTAGVQVSATFTDASTPFDTHTGVIEWGDGSSTAATVIEPTLAMDGTVDGTHTYSEPGVYAIKMTVTDASGEADSRDYEFVVVYDPAAGRVSGSGLYYSNPASRPGGSRWGTIASFGYNAQYKRGADKPIGQTQLKLFGDFFFRSTTYDYLIVNDTMAVAEGVGTIGGGSQYRFRVQGIDNGWVDFFQITIWDPASGDILYDNGVLYNDGDRILLGGINVRS